MEGLDDEILTVWGRHILETVLCRPAAAKFFVVVVACEDVIFLVSSRPALFPQMRLHLRIFDVTKGHSTREKR